MTDCELDELGTSLLALSKQITRSRKPVPESKPEPAEQPIATEWTPEQMKRLDDVFRG